MHMKDGSLQPMPNTIVILSPSEGGTAYHYSVTDQGVEPYQLPPEKRTFSTPTPTFADDGTPLKHPQEEALKLVYRKHETEACDRAWETIWPQPIVITH